MFHETVMCKEILIGSVSLDPHKFPEDVLCDVRVQLFPPNATAGAMYPEATEATLHVRMRLSSPLVDDVRFLVRIHSALVIATILSSSH